MPRLSSISRLLHRPLVVGGLCLVGCAPAPAPTGSVTLKPVSRPAEAPAQPATVRLEASAAAGAYHVAALPSASWSEARATCYSPTAMTGGAGKSLAFASWTYFPGGTPPYYQNNAGSLPLPAVRPAADYGITYDLIANLSSTQKIVRGYGWVANQTLVPGANSLHVTLRGAGTVSTFAGRPDLADGASSSAMFIQPWDVEVDASGNLFVSDMLNHCIRRIDGATGAVSTFAGYKYARYLDGVGTGAALSSPRGLVFSGTGDLFVADTGNHRIRKVAPDGTVTTVAGSGSGYLDDPNPLVAKFSSPSGLALAADGTLYVAESGNHAVRRIDGVTKAVTTVAGHKLNPDGTYSGFADGVGGNAQFYSPYDLALDGAGHLYVADANNHRVRAIDLATGAVTTLAGSGAQGSANGVGTAATFNYAASILYDGAGSLYVGELSGQRLRKIDIATAGVTTVAGTGGGNHVDNANPLLAQFYYLCGLGRDAAGNLYIGDREHHAVRKYVPGGGVTTVAGNSAAGYVDGPPAVARFRYPTMISTDAAGDAYVADLYNHAIRKIAPDGTVSTVAGTGLPNSSVVNAPQGVYAAPDGYVYFTDTYQRVARVLKTGGAVQTVAGGTAIAGSYVGYVDGAGGAARFYNPRGMVMDSAGNLFIADQANHCIRKLVPSTGVVTTFAGHKDNGDGTYNGFADGVGASAQFYSPRGLTIDAQDNLYVADQSNHRIRKIAPDGTVTTVVGVSPGSLVEGLGARFNNPVGLTRDAGGNVFVADLSNFRVRKIALDGFGTTMAGMAGSANYYGHADGAAESARFGYLQDVALAPDGGLYVVDSTNNAIRKIK